MLKSPHGMISTSSLKSMQDVPSQWNFSLIIWVLPDDWHVPNATVSDSHCCPFQVSVIVVLAQEQLLTLTTSAVRVGGSWYAQHAVGISQHWVGLAFDIGDSAGNSTQIG
jgi:hypothetical protein